MERTMRPQYYDGQYLGADDLEAIVDYAKTAQARHALAAHLWGIGIGLDLVERALTGDDVEMVLTPGVAWDGYARPLVATAPQRIGLDLFADFQDDTPPAGVQLGIWIEYRELPASPPGVGFSCPEDDLHGRIVETFRVEVRRTAGADFHGVSVAARTIEAKAALSAFDPSKPPLHDESVPHQAFPDTDRQRWPLFIGLVRWRKDPGQPGRLIKRTDADRNDSRRGRQYLGVVAEAIVAADGVLRLRNRAIDPNSPAIAYKAPLVAAPAGSAPNDLVWCEGHLRVVGDARLQGGKLDYRVADGSDGQIPMYLRRTVLNAPVAKTSLDAFIGPPPLPPGPPPPPPLPQTRFTVSTTDNANNPKECLTVVTDGRVGINSAEPSNTLEVKGPTGIRYGLGYLTGDDGAGWTGLAFNAFAQPGGWVIPPGHKSAAVVLDDAGNVPEVKVQTNSSGNPAAWDVHLVVKGDTGNVGIGTVAPTAKAHLHSANPAQGDLQLFSATADIEYDGGSDKVFVIRDTGGKTVLVGGDVGIGATPMDRLHVAKGSHLNAIFDRTDTQDHLTVVVGSAGSGLRFAATNEFFIASQPYANRADGTFGNEHLRIRANGDVGIGTNAPQERLHVIGSRIRLGTNAKRIDLRTDGSAVDLHSETHNLYLRSSGAGGNNRVIINPFNTDGNVGIGTQTPNAAYKVDIAGNLHITGQAYKDSMGGSWQPSDADLKKDVKPIANPLEKVLGLKGVSFAWREPERFGARRGKYLGFVAQDVEKVFPEWVETTPDGIKAINPIGLEALLVESIRELTERVRRLEEEIATLRAKRSGPDSRRESPKKKRAAYRSRRETDQ